jgi:hypothetical protein
VPHVGCRSMNYWKVFQTQHEELKDPKDVLELVGGIYTTRHEYYAEYSKDEVRTHLRDARESATSNIDLGHGHQTT